MLCIAANKQDTDLKLRVVSHAEAVAFAISVGATLFRTSARSGEGCDDLLMDAAQRGFEARGAHSGLNSASGAARNDKMNSVGSITSPTSEKCALLHLKGCSCQWGCSLAHIASLKLLFNVVSGLD